MEFIEAELRDGFLLITCGLPGTLKTAIAGEISRARGYPALRTDLLRQEVLKGEDIFDEGVASDMERRVRVYEEMFKRADEALDKTDGVILDATFITQSLRRRAAEIAARHNKAFVIVQTDCAWEVAVARILRRGGEGYRSNAVTERAYLNNKKEFEKVDLEDFKTLYPDLDVVHLVVDASQEQPPSWHVIRAQMR
ncbi:MAG: AAA family ATPase [Chloroflexi bacterium]|nr:AAA family ATPase [Chloroflexota bacterium]